jgi:hypothetical protein
MQWEKNRFLGHFIRCMNEVNFVRKLVGTILGGGFNKYNLFLSGHYGQRSEA